MNELRKAAEMALEALEIGYDSAQAEAHQFHAAMAGYKPQRHAAMDADVQKIAAAITALRQAIAEQPAQQEPVATVRTWHKNGDQHAELWNWDRGIESLPDGEHDLYTRPQAPATPLHGEPLTDEEIAKAWSQSKGDIFMRLKPFARAIEAAHGIKEFLK